MGKLHVISARDWRLIVDNQIFIDEKPFTKGVVGETTKGAHGVIATRII